MKDRKHTSVVSTKIRGWQISTSASRQQWIDHTRLPVYCTSLQNDRYQSSNERTNEWVHISELFKYSSYMAKKKQVKYIRWTTRIYFAYCLRNKLCNQHTNLSRVYDLKSSWFFFFRWKALHMSVRGLQQSLFQFKWSLQTCAYSSRTETIHLQNAGLSQEIHRSQLTAQARTYSWTLLPLRREIAEVADAFFILRIIIFRATCFCTRRSASRGFAQDLHAYDSLPCSVAESPDRLPARVDKGHTSNEPCFSPSPPAFTEQLRLVSPTKQLSLSFFFSLWIASVLLFPLWTARGGFLASCCQAYTHLSHQVGWQEWISSVIEQ